MAKNLLVVESPAKSRTLARFLGKDFDVFSTVGHLVDLPKSKLGVKVDDGFEPEYKVIKGKENIVKELTNAAKKAQRVYLAPDPDREGEAIAWHVANQLKKSKADIVRVTFNEITKAAVQEAINHPRKVDQHLVNAQQARRVLDRLVGYMVSPLLWKTVARNLSAGRVQSVALRLICEREDEIRRFVTTEYWQVAAELLANKKEAFTAQLVSVDGKTVAKGDDEGGKKYLIGNQQLAEAIVAELKGLSFTIAEVRSSERVRRPSPPFITSTLQQEAAKAYGFSPKQTMQLAQALYEGVEIGKEGPVGLITYIRTDSTRLSDEATKGARALITAAYGEKYLPSSPNTYGKGKSAQDAHEAIRPTYLDHPPDKLKKYLTAQQMKLYTLIWNRFLASQMTPAVFDQQTVEISAGRFGLRATAQTLRFDGYLKVYHEEREADEAANGNGNGNGEGSNQKLPALLNGQQVTAKEITPTQSFTRPPARYSEAALVKRLEADGIGRPSTYASIISTIKDRKYVELQEKRLTPTQLGDTVNKILVEHFPDLFNVAFTAEMEKELDQVEEGEIEWAKVVGDFYKPFRKAVAKVESNKDDIKQSMTEVTDIACEICGSPMVVKWGRNGQFLACSAYPDCRSTRPLPEEEARNKTDEICEKCHSPMVVKSGRFGRFLACSAYPECRNTKAMTLGIGCPRPDCGGQLVEKTTKGRKIFFGCSKYPKCDYASWDRPVKKPCPVCQHPFMVEKSSKTKGGYHKCPECGHQIGEDKNENQVVNAAE